MKEEVTDADWKAPLNFSQRGNTQLAWRFQAKGKVTVVYLGGFHSSMNGIKALKVFEYALSGGYSALCFDYSGHGSSGGNFDDGTVSQWLEDALFIIDQQTQGRPIILVGSSMGAWISLLVALRKDQQVQGIVTIAAATDMTERYIWQKCPPATRTSLLEQGFFYWENQYGEDPFKITMKLIEDGRKYLLLEKSIAISCPVRMIHGTSDTDIAWHNSVATLHCLTSTDVRLELVKNAGHRLSEPENVAAILQLLDEIFAKLR